MPVFSETKWPILFSTGTSVTQRLSPSAEEVESDFVLIFLAKIKSPSAL
jgi:hypothetical protein